MNPCKGSSLNENQEQQVLQISEARRDTCSTVALVCIQSSQRAWSDRQILITFSSKPAFDIGCRQQQRPGKSTSTSLAFFLMRHFESWHATNCEGCCLLVAIMARLELLLSACSVYCKLFKLEGTIVNNSHWDCHLF
jgi:hypothetical protein